jgi:hypothetical protein
VSQESPVTKNGAAAEQVAESFATPQMRFALSQTHMLVSACRVSASTERLLSLSSSILSAPLALDAQSSNQL